jgi:hypothetical protein
MKIIALARRAEQSLLILQPLLSILRNSRHSLKLGSVKRKSSVGLGLRKRLLSLAILLNYETFPNQPIRPPPLNPEDMFRVDTERRFYYDLRIGLWCRRTYQDRSNALRQESEGEVKQGETDVSTVVTDLS